MCIIHYVNSVWEEKSRQSGEHTGIAIVNCQVLDMLWRRISEVWINFCCTTTHLSYIDYSILTVFCKFIEVILCLIFLIFLATSASIMTFSQT